MGSCNHIVWLSHAAKCDLSQMYVDRAGLKMDRTERRCKGRNRMELEDSWRIINVTFS